MNRQAYERVHVLLLTWEDDSGEDAHEGGEHEENEFKKQMGRLADILQCGYSFDVETWSIPSESSSNALDSKLDEFLRKDGSNKDSARAASTLFIIYYGGHAIRNQNDGADLILVPCETDNPQHHQISWRVVVVAKLQLMLSADALILLDCCYASRAYHALNANFRSPTNTVVVLAATSDDGKALMDGDRTFTKNIRRQLVLFQKIPSFTIMEFHGGLASQALKWREGSNEAEKKLIHIPQCLTPPTQNSFMAMSRISKQAACPKSTPETAGASSGIQKAVETRPSQAQKNPMAIPRISQDAALSKPNAEKSGERTQMIQAHKVDESIPADEDNRRRFSFSSASTASDSSDSDEAWQSRMASLKEEAERHDPPQKKPDTPTPAPPGLNDPFNSHNNMMDDDKPGPGFWGWISDLWPEQTQSHSPPPAPHAIYDQFNSNTNMMDDDKEGPGIWNRISDFLPKQTRPYSPPPAPHALYDQFNSNTNMMDDEKDWPGLWGEPETKTDAVDTSSSKNDDTGIVEVESRKSSLDSSTSRDDSKPGRFLSQWD